MGGAAGVNSGGLPPYTVRLSDRARRVRLTVTARDGLVVVVPRGSRIDAGAVVASKQAWARRALASVAEKRDLHQGGPTALLPATVQLRASGQSREVACLDGVTARVVDAGARLEVIGVDDAARLSALRRWLDRVARAELPPRLAALSEQHGLGYSRVRVTRARSRWGSCSARGTISLNRSLVFLPPHLVDALMLHELAHTRVMDHSPRFWSVLTQLDERALAHRAELKRAGTYVPAWADV